MVTPYALYVGARNVIITIHYATIELFLYNRAVDAANDWLRCNPDVYVGLSTEGTRLVQKCIKYLQFMISAREKLDMPPLKGFDAKGVLLYLRALLNDYPTPPPKTERPNGINPRGSFAFILNRSFIKQLPTRVRPPLSDGGRIFYARRWGVFGLTSKGKFYTL